MTTITRRITHYVLWAVAALLTLGIVALVAVGVLVWSLIEGPTDRFGKVEDEARAAGRKAEQFPGAGEPYFAAMDKGLLLTPTEGSSYPKEVLEVAAATGLEPEAVRQAAVRGQNAWLVWTGGNDRFWDYAARNTIGSFDLLKTISSHPSQAYGHDNRFRYLGLINEPCFEKPAGPDPEHFGLWIDQRDRDCEGGEDPFGGNPAADKRYPGVAVGQRGKPVLNTATGKTVTLPVGSYYGEPTGVMGLRLFANPDFDETAAKAWDPKRYYTDPDYYNRGDLVRPYRVGMSCAFCHVGPNPMHTPGNVEKPAFADIASNPGAQYFWVDRIFFWNTAPRGKDGKPSQNEGNFLFQLFHTNPPGTLDTSLVSSDYMNNPRTMNAVYEVAARLQTAAKAGQETLEGGERDNRQFQDYPQTAKLSAFYDETSGKSLSMRVLKDGSDSVGTLGALNRVYLNIGLFSEEWLLHFRPFLGGQKISPIRIADAKKNSVYWQATEAMTADMATFFLVTARADRLADLDGYKDQIANRPPEQVARGRVVFAETCAACHSSKQPVPPVSYGVDLGQCAGGGAGPQYRQCWDRYWAWARSDAFKAGMRALVEQPDFLEGNYLSTERRVPLDLLGTNACSAIATNGLAGDIWDNFTSSTYKTLPPSGEVTIHHPVSGGAAPFQPLGNGRGYIRPASLVSLWSTAPYLLNNSVGHPDYYSGEGTAGRQVAGLATAAGPAPSAAYGAVTPVSDALSPLASPSLASPPLPSPGTAASSAKVYGTYQTGYGSACPSGDPSAPYMPCVENRLALFETSLRQMLSPETRRRDTVTKEPVPGYIYRTSAPSCLIVPKGFVPEAIRPFSRILNTVAPWAFKHDGSITLGPFPADFPINALTNTQLLPDHDDPAPFDTYKRLLANAPALIETFARLGGQCTPDELADPQVRTHAETVVRETGLIDRLVGLSKCPDYVVNAGHAFGADLPPADKEALISYVKQF
ncbi:hypothetical protein [Rhizobium halophytocola]|uniref:Cytochrome c domain-containing protein n=1 Tax=Rhizobium halophytocola TaxID=735519 RepID=A0ABS4DUK9_9HYPH|nr:hypothetical protein [Rhizobium halophytocola]MBP1849377.1 hypothetical protein [Rhizobium halophytocola]